jgi:hypothetical protein
MTLIDGYHKSKDWFRPLIRGFKKRRTMFNMYLEF